MRFVLFHVKISIFLILELEHKSMCEAVLKREFESAESKIKTTVKAKTILGEKKHLKLHRRDPNDKPVIPRDYCLSPQMPT